MKKYLISISMVALAACNSDENKTENKADTASKFMNGTFGYDLNFLNQYHKDLVVLGDSTSAQIIIAPAYQGRVMTSTAEGNKGISFGWVNHELISSGKTAEHFNAFGGEDRIWLGPEGGQFSIFFKKGDPFDLAHWQTPALIDSEAWTVAERTAQQVFFKRDSRLVNYSGTRFDFRIERTVRLVERDAAAKALGA